MFFLSTRQSRKDRGWSGCKLRPTLMDGVVNWRDPWLPILKNGIFGQWGRFVDLEKWPKSLRCVWCWFFVYSLLTIRDRPLRAWSSRGEASPTKFYQWCLMATRGFTANVLVSSIFNDIELFKNVIVWRLYAQQRGVDRPKGSCNSTISGPERRFFSIDCYSCGEHERFFLKSE